MQTIHKQHSLLTFGGRFFVQKSRKRNSKLFEPTNTFVLCDL
jgi:hypothetical protein